MAQPMPPDKLGTMVMLGMEVEVEAEDETENETEWIHVNVWMPNELLEKDKHIGMSYYDCIDGMSWDDWTQPFAEFMDANMCETGQCEVDVQYHDVRLDDPRVQVAYVDPLNDDYDKRCLSKEQLEALRIKSA